jgi:metal-responsive CopG/Arc/MetJ family transcriptional regulator
MAAKKRAETREGMVVTTVALDEELHKRLAFAAIEDGAALTELVRVAVREYLDARDKRLRRRTK